MKNSKIVTMIEAIKSFFFKSNGILLLNKHDLSGEIHEYYNEVICDLEMKKSSEDKKNLKMDGANIRVDIKKAVASYHSEFING